MSEDNLPAGTTLLIKGGRALTPDSDWHQPPCVDIAIAGDTSPASRMNIHCTAVQRSK